MVAPACAAAILNQGQFVNRMDRLNALRIFLEGRRLVKAQEIADYFGLSLRTIYRDIKSLQEAGIPIEGEAGMGYQLARKPALRPITFDSSEALSLLIAAKTVQRHLDAHHHALFEQAIRKIRAALPLNEQDHLERLEHKIAFPEFGASKKGILNPLALAPIQKALLQGEQLSILYNSQNSQSTLWRTVVPIGILYYSGYWHLIAWCMVRSGYRDFRVDRILEITDPKPVKQKIKLLALDQYLHQSARQWSPSGLVSSHSLTECVVRFSPSVSSLYEKSRFYFGFVRQKNIDQGPYQQSVQATFYTDNLDEFCAWLLCFENQAQVVSPQNVADLYLQKKQSFLLT